VVGLGPIAAPLLSAVAGRFIGVLGELNFNIWLMDLPHRRTLVSFSRRAWLHHRSRPAILFSSTL
jgi:hypothetical protein